MSVLATVIHRSNAIPVKIPADKNIKIHSKIYMKFQGSPNRQNNLEIEEVEGLILIVSKLLQNYRNQNSVLLA